MIIKITFHGLFLFGCCLLCIVKSSPIDVAECPPPDYPQHGGYGPRQDFYVAGDIIHYYCDSESYMHGNYLRICEDNGAWFGDTPVCDMPAEFSLVNQTSTESPAAENNAEWAIDGFRSTCSSTGSGGSGQQWMGLFKNPGELIRVMVFMPRGEVSYEVVLLKQNGQTLSCGTKNAQNDRLRWEFHNCPGPNNRDAIGVRIRSTSSRLLQICEVVTHVLTSPTCTDPHLHIDNGRLAVSRKTASLVCEVGFTRGPTNRIECMRDGVWNRKSLYCLEKQWNFDQEDKDYMNEI